MRPTYRDLLCRDKRCMVGEVETGTHTRAINSGIRHEKMVYERFQVTNVW